MSYYVTKTFEHEILTPEEEIELGKIIRKSDPKSKEYEEAIHKLTSFNLRLVAKEAQNFSKKSSAEIGDLVGEGFLGLVHAAEKYDPEKSNNARFASYATYWIQQKIRTYINNLSIAHVPSHLLQDVIKHKKLVSESFNSDKKEIMEKLKVDSKHLSIIEGAHVKSVSMSSPICSDAKGEKDIKVEDAIKDEKTPTPYEKLANNDKRKVLSEAINKLSSMEKDIIISQFYNDEKITLHDIGVKYQLTSERIRQIKVGALEKMKTYLKERKLNLAKI